MVLRLGVRRVLPWDKSPQEDAAVAASIRTFSLGKGWSWVARDWPDDWLLPGYHLPNLRLFCCGKICWICKLLGPLDADYRGMHWFLLVEAKACNKPSPGSLAISVGRTENPLGKQATIHTTMGDIVVKLFHQDGLQKVCRLSLAKSAKLLYLQSLPGFHLHLVCLTPAWLVHYWTSIKLFSEMSERRTIALEAQTRGVCETPPCFLQLKSIPFHCICDRHTSLKHWRSLKECPKSVENFTVHSKNGYYVWVPAICLLCILFCLQDSHGLATNWIKRSNIKSFFLSTPWQSVRRSHFVQFLNF